MEISKTFYAKNRKEWRNWLDKNHKKEKDIWLIYYNKKSGKPRVEYNDAVEEALCYGWIDSIIKNIDEEKFSQRFTPRNPKSKWSESNLERVRRLKKENKMMPSGLASLSKNHASVVSKSVELKIPSDIKKELMKNKIACSFCNNSHSILGMIGRVVIWLFLFPVSVLLFYLAGFPCGRQNRWQ